MKAFCKSVRTRTAVIRDSVRDFVVGCFSWRKRSGYFEGWYFKHQNEDTVLAFIPGQSIDRGGKKHPFLQIIWNESSYFLDFKEDDYLVDRRQGKVILGNNIFSRRGVKVDLISKDIAVYGTIRYGSLSPINYPIMGPFRFVPFMECRHEIISMAHVLQGKITVNGRVLDFNGETGYIEGDRGRSFPRDYLWLQCNRFRENASVMAAVAHIPFMGSSFQGCIAVVRYNGKEYRFATYLGTKIICRRETAVVLKQGDYELKIFLSNRIGDRAARFSHKLTAPTKGKMNRHIKEEHLVQGRFLLYKEEELIFDLSSRYVSFEFSEKGALQK